MKLCAKGEGPPVDCYHGYRPLRRPATILAWAKGPDFQPITFRLDVAYSTANVDKKGNALPTVTARHLTDAESAVMEANCASEETTLISAIQNKPGATLIELATACEWFVNGNRERPNKAKAHRLITSAEKAKLIQKAGGSYTLTKAGKAALAKPAKEG